ncbi:MAG: outer membrane protein assembly factor BamB family protein [Planctomycetota bacterium]
MKKALFLIVLVALSMGKVEARDWPQFRGDAARSGYTSEHLPADLSLRWVYKPGQTPRPAWRGSDTRMTFDYAPQPIIASGMVFFAGSTDNKVYALDLGTGSRKWHFFTDSPVRFAPAFWNDRLYVSSDDGYLYCLSAQTGEIVWKKRGGPGDDMLLGNGRMISRWPFRGAATILDGIVYVGAGIWPSEGIYLYALDPDTGKTLWGNDSSGGLVMDQPHGGARARSGVSAQGYLSAAGDTLLVPTGRAVPAAFNRTDGTFRYFHLQRYGKVRPGPFVAQADDLTLSGNSLFQTEDGQLLLNKMPGPALAVFPQQIVFAQGQTIKGIDRSKPVVEQQTKDLEGKVTRKIHLSPPSWTMQCSEPLGTSLIGAGDTIVAGTRNDKVITADIRSKSVITTAEVDGEALGLAAASGCLIVTTDEGTIHCFAEKSAKDAVEISAKRKKSAYGKNKAYAEVAAKIIARTDKTKGYCLDVGCGTGRLAYELAKRTDLHIYAVDSDPVKVAEARELLDAAGLYGTRVTVLQRHLAETNLPDYFADLVVSAESVENGDDNVPRKEIDRLLKPYGGAACLGRPERMIVTFRGPLEGAGNWTHQYCDPANTNCSTDELVAAPLEMLWFADNDFEMPSRHGRGPAPLCLDGRIFVEGMHGLRAIDAYNGRILWEYSLGNILEAYDQEHLMGTAGTGSNFCVTNTGLYVRRGGQCLLLDPGNGKLIAEFMAPKHPEGGDSTWGYIACENGTLFGTVADTEHIVKYRFGRSDMTAQFTESVLLFAMDAKTGELRWTYRPKHSIRNNSIAIGKGRIFLLDAPLALGDRPDAGEKHQMPRKEADLPVGSESPATLIALNADDGQPAWKSSDDIYGTMLALSTRHDILLMAYQDTRFKLPSELGGRMTAFRASDGDRLWDIEADYASRPIINDRTIYAQPGAWDLLTGAGKDFRFERSYGCGILAGSQNLLAFRSATIGYRGLEPGKETENYGGIRPGCWINTIPAAGLLLVPEAANKCVCGYLMKATIALQPKRQ